VVEAVFGFYHSTQALQKTKVLPCGTMLCSEHIGSFLVLLPAEFQARNNDFLVPFNQLPLGFDNQSLKPRKQVDLQAWM
jgi:hypothetical protein